MRILARCGVNGVDIAVAGGFEDEAFPVRGEDAPQSPQGQLGDDLLVELVPGRSGEFLVLEFLLRDQVLCRFQLGDRRHERQVDVDPQLTAGWQVGDLHAGREIAGVPLYCQHSAEVIGHRFALPFGEVAGHLVDNRVLLPGALSLAAYGQLMI